MSSPKTGFDQDVVIVGGGPAGLSAALVLGRCRRRVVLCDDGRYRNAAAHKMHGFLTRDGVTPDELRRIGREQLAPYDTVQISELTVAGGECLDPGFELVLADGTRIRTRFILLATGITDELPPLNRIHEFYGKSVHHCPYCDAWEWRDMPIAVLGRGEKLYQLACTLSAWSRALVLCGNGPLELEPQWRDNMERLGCSYCDESIVDLEGHDGLLEHIVLQSGHRLAVRALFFSAPAYPRSDLSRQLGCAFEAKESVVVSGREESSVSGVFVAGDATRDVHFAVVAAAEGATAAAAINKRLTEEFLEGLWRNPSIF